MEERQWRDLSLCLNLLQYTEKSIAKLYENISCFANKLACDAVHEHIMSIITSTRKLPNIKTDTKSLLDEFEQKVKEYRSKGVEEPIVEEAGEEQITDVSIEK